MDPNFIDKLNVHHASQLRAYLKFSQQRQQSIQREIGHSFNDTKEMNLTDNVYTAEEVGQTLDALQSLVESDLRSELERHSHQSVLLLSQMFLQAEAQGLHVNLDAAALEDQQLLNILQNYAASGALDGMGTRLPSMSSDVDISLVTKNKDLQSQVDSLQSHVTKLQEQLRQAATRQAQSDERESQLLKERATLEQDLQRSAQSNHTEELSKELAALRIKMTEMEKTHADVLADTQGKLDAARAELTGKIQATAQYRQLQKMVQDKNNLLKELRANLRVYEEKSAE